MKRVLTAVAIGTFLAACGNDQATGPDPRNCTAGSIAAGDLKTGTLNNTSCLRYDYFYSSRWTGDSVYYASYDVTLDSGKAYMFKLYGTPVPTFFDATLELVGKDLNTNEDALYAISDDEGNDGGSNIYFIAPTSGAFSLRVSGYDTGDTASYALQEGTCRVGHAQVTGSLSAFGATLQANDCVLQHPLFGNDSSNIQLYSIWISANETKSVTVTSSTFSPGISWWGPGFGTFCYYEYQGCDGWADPNYFDDVAASGRNPAKGSVGGTASITLTADGYYGWNDFDFFGYNDWPGAYTLAVGASGGSFGVIGDYTLTVESNPNSGSSVAGMVPNLWNGPIVLTHGKPSRRLLHPRVHKAI